MKYIIYQILLMVMQTVSFMTIGAIVVFLGFGSRYLLDIPQTYFNFLFISLVLIGLGVFIFITEYHIIKIIKNFNTECRKCRHLFVPEDFQRLINKELMGIFNNFEANMAVYQVYFHMPIYDKCPNCQNKDWFFVQKEKNEEYYHRGS